MADWAAVTVTAFISVAVTLVTSMLAFRIGIERRLTTVETTLAQHPPIAVADRLRAAEMGIQALEQRTDEMAPLKGMLNHFGEDKMRDAIRNGGGR